MLLKFVVGNFMSYKETQEFSMIAGATRSYEERLKQIGDNRVLKFSAIYGANASGKSNIVNAMSYVRSLVINGVPSYRLPCYFKMDDGAKEKPTYFETYLSIEDNLYSYGVEYDSSKNCFVSEWLVSLKKNKDVFSRDITKGTYSFDKKLDDKTGHKLSSYLEDLKNDGGNLFLSYINKNSKNPLLEKPSPIKDVFAFFLNDLIVTSPSSILTSGDYFLVEEKINKLAHLLGEFDTGVKSIGYAPVDAETGLNTFPSFIINSMRSNYATLSKGENKRISFLARINNELWNVSMNGDDMQFAKVCFYHDEDKKYPFSLREESTGTVRIIDIAEILLTDANGKVFVMDELDRALHPQLTCKFVQMFLDEAKTKDNQLIVTTHESRLLDFDILRRDEIWFVDKKDGASSLYSLEEFNVRFDKRIDKAYLDGRYGGVPIFDSVFPSISKCQE